MIRGEVYQANLDPVTGSEQGAMRPVLIVSRDALNANAPIVIVVPLTSRENKKRLYPTHVELAAGEGSLSKNSVALCEQVRPISKNRLTKRIGQLSSQRMSMIGATLMIALDLPDRLKV
jgi:mRNA interferase MazF